MGRPDHLDKLPRFDEPVDSRRPEIPPPPRLPSISPPTVSRHVPPPMRGARPSPASEVGSRPPPPPLPRRRATSAPPPPAARTRSAAPENEPVERVDLHAVMQQAIPITLDETDVDLVCGSVAPSDQVVRIPKHSEDQPSLAPVSMSSDELEEELLPQAQPPWARVAVAAGFGALLLGGLFLWTMQSPRFSRSASAAIPEPTPLPLAQVAAIAQQTAPTMTLEAIAAAAPLTEPAAGRTPETARTVASDKPAATIAEPPRRAPRAQQAAAPALEDYPPEPEEQEAQAPAAAQEEGTPPATPPEPQAPPFNAAAAQAALDAAAGRAAGCLAAGEPAGLARVNVTFAPSGNVTVASVVGPPFAGSPTGGCIARAFRSAQVPPFDGKTVSVGKTVSLR